MVGLIDGQINWADDWSYSDDKANLHPRAEKLAELGNKYHKNLT